MDKHVPVIIVGGGQAGLSVSYCLRERSVEHVVFERHRVAHSWRTERWDSFCLVTPNWQCRLPGHPYRGPDPDGFMVKDEIVAYVESYAQAFDPPLELGIDVRSAEPDDSGGFRVETSRGCYRCEQLVVATGAYHAPRIPKLSAALPHHWQQLHATSYRNPDALPPGVVLVVGSGQSGCQIAEDLFFAGREVHLSVGSAPRVARRYRGRDVVAWLEDMGHYDTPIDAMPDPDATRQKTNHYVTGRDGGRDIDLRRHALSGMRLHGSLCGYEGSYLQFEPNLAHQLDAADATFERINRNIDAHISQLGLSAPEQTPYQAPWRPLDEPVRLRAEGISSVIWCTGYASRFQWVRAPIFGPDGLPQHHRGVTGQPGLYFIGLPWLHSWGSGRFSHVARDAAYLADRVAARVANKRAAGAAGRA